MPAGQPAQESTQGAACEAGAAQGAQGAAAPCMGGYAAPGRRGAEADNRGREPRAGRPPARRRRYTRTWGTERRNTGRQAARAERGVENGAPARRARGCRALWPPCRTAGRRGSRPFGRPAHAGRPAGAQRERPVCRAGRAGGRTPAGGRGARRRAGMPAPSDMGMPAPEAMGAPAPAPAAGTPGAVAVPGAQAAEQAPVVQRAMQLVQRAQRSEGERVLNSQIRRISELDPAVKNAGRHCGHGHLPPVRRAGAQRRAAGRGLQGREF